MKKLFLLMIFILLGQNHFVHAAILEVSKANVQFTAKGFPSFLKIKGTSKTLKGILDETEKDKKLTGKIILDLDTLNTGISLRDDHMKKNYLETGKFKNAVLVIPPFSPLDKGTTKGLLTMRNIEKEIDIDYVIVKTDQGIKVKTKFKLNITDFKIPVPQYQGITVAKTVELKIDLEANRK